MHDRTRYIKNFEGSGLDNVNDPGIRHRISRSFSNRAFRPVFIDDPDSSDYLDIGIRQRELHTVFASYLRYQNEFYLGGILEGINSRLIRFFWRALTFGGPGGSDWPRSIVGGRNSLLSLFRLLNLPPSRVTDLWNIRFINNKVDSIEDISTLKQLARDVNSRVRNTDIMYWRNRAKEEIRIGLGTARYFQAVKTAAIAEAFMNCSWDDSGIPLNPF